jgi:hypothetical protein
MKLRVPHLAMYRFSHDPVPLVAVLACRRGAAFVSMLNDGGEEVWSRVDECCVSGVGGGCSSTDCTSVSGAGGGTTKVFWHPGHFTRLPDSDAGMESDFWQYGQFIYGQRFRGG